MSEQRFIRMLRRNLSKRETLDHMTPKARIMTALNCDVPDRVPVCLPGFNLYAWADESYNGVLEQIATYGDPIYDVFLGYDPIDSLPTAKIVKEELPDGKIIQKVNTPKGELTQITKPFVGQTNHPNRAKLWVSTPHDIERVLSIPYEPYQPDISKILQIEDELNDLIPTVVTVNEPMECMNGLMGTTNFCLWSIDEKELIKALLDALYERIMDALEFLCQQDWKSVYRLSGSEMTIPPLMSLEAYQEFSAPYQQAMVQKLKSYGHKVIIHSHSKVSQLLETYANMGADGTDPCEPLPMGDVDLAQAKKRVGNRLSLWGNVEYNELSEASEERIEHLVRETIARGATGGGFVLMTCARLYERTLTDRARKNILQYLEAGRKYGRYPISLQ